jgi:HAE1 family hydrophobic/amphiphilic exporter-1
MNLSEISIRQHVLAWMISLLIVVFGWMSYDKVGIDRFPAVEFPIISITTGLLGANPDIMDASITSVIESNVNGLAGIEHIQSKSSAGVSQVYITFQLEKNIDVAFNEVQAKVNQILNQLPEETQPPIVSKMQAGGAPVIWYALQGDRTAQQLNQYAKLKIKKKLETINGVGQVVIGGQQKRQIRIQLNIEKMNAFGLSVLEIIQAIKKEHIQLPGGFLTHGQSEYVIKLDEEFHHINDIKMLPIMRRGGTVIDLQDVAKIEDSVANQRQLARFNGASAIGIGLVKTSGSNTVSIVREAEIRVAKEIMPYLPPGITLTKASDDGEFIELMVGALEEHLITGTLLTALVMWFFLKDIRATLIISLSIPVSILGAVAAMHFMGYTFNTMTLLALLLLIGVVVDDSIVVLENIHRLAAEKDATMQEISIEGVRQVQLAVVAASLTLVSIFAAVLFMDGIIGRFFQEFGVVVTVGVMISLLVSLTLIPMLASRYLIKPVLKVPLGSEAEPISKSESSLAAQTSRFGQFKNKISTGQDRLLKGLESFYLGLLEKVLAKRKKTLWISLLFILLAGSQITQVGKSFMPKEDQGQFIVSFKTPLGSSMNYTLSRLELIETALQQDDAVLNSFSTIGGGATQLINEGRIVVSLKPFDERDTHMTQVMQRLSHAFDGIPGIKAFPAPVPMMSDQRGDPLRFVLQGDNLQQLAQLSADFLEKLKDQPKLGDLDLELQLNQPQISFEIDRHKATLYGLDTQAIAQSINVLAGGINVGKYSDARSDGERYDLRLDAQQGQLTKASDLSKIYIKSNLGKLVSLDTVANLKTEAGAAIIPRHDLRYAGMFYGNPSVSLGEAVKIVQKQAEGFLPDEVQLKMTGQAAEFKKTAHYIQIALFLSVILVYMVLASQFNSFIQPLIIMWALPFAIVGGIVGLAATNMSLNIFSMVGLVLLMGLVAKNSILLVDLTNQKLKEKEGTDNAVYQALVEACPQRLRPVLMTSITVVVTMLPSAMGWGAGSDANAPLAVAVIGGMVTSTLMSLVVVPVVYSLIYDAKGMSGQFLANQKLKFEALVPYNRRQSVYQSLEFKLDAVFILGAELWLWMTSKFKSVIRGVGRNQRLWGIRQQRKKDSK